MTPAHALPAPNATFGAYLQANRDFWRRFPVAPTPPDTPGLAIDLLVNHPSYVIGNCIIGKYLQQHFGWRPVALIRGTRDGTVGRIAESFNIPTVETYDDAVSINMDRDLRGLIAGQSPQEQRATMLNLTINNVRIGDLIYDSILRTTGNGTIERFDDQVLQYAYMGIKDFIQADRLIHKHNVRASVQGHIVYSQFGSLARLVIHNGGQVFARKAAGGPFTLRRYRDLDSVRDYEYVFSAQEFASIWDSRRAEAIATAEAFMRERMAHAVTAVSYDGAEAYGKNKRRYTKAALLDQLGLDPRKPTVCVMSHVFPDAPHTFSRSLYDDYVLWLRATLELIKDMPQTNWLIKPHPDNHHYNPKHDAEMETEPYAQRYPHIALAPGDCNTASLFDIVDGVVTVCGTAGLEFPCWGIPSLNAGKSFYTGFGFTIEPLTHEDYAQALRRHGHDGRLSLEQKERALVAAFLYYFASRVTSRYVPDVPDVFWIPRNDDEVWSEALQAIRSGTFWDDPLYQALAKQLHDNADHIMAPRLPTS